VLRSLVVSGVVLVSASVALLGSPARAEEGVTKSITPRAKWTDEAAQVRLHYGGSIRSGTEDDGGPGLTYSGATANDLSASIWAWFLLGDHLGLTGSFGREAFSLLDGSTVVTSGGLMRVSVGPTGRVRLGPVRLEAAVEYAFHQLPLFGTVTTPVFVPATRHGILLAARGLVDLGPVTVEGRFEATPALASPVSSTGSFGLGAGGGLRVQLFRAGPLKFGLMGEVMWHRDTITSTTGSSFASAQSVVRVGGALDVQWKDAALDKEVTTGALEVRVNSGGAPLAGAEVSVDVGATHRTGTTDAQGVSAFGELQPGQATIVVTMAGFERAESTATVVVGETASTGVAVNREKPKVGSLAVKVINFDGKAAVANVSLEINGQAAKTNDQGTLTVENLKPGPVAVKAMAPGFTAGEEAASIVAGSTSDLVITLVPEKKKVPATLSGQVRSARGGKPVSAQLEIKELKQTIACDDAGAFTVQIPGGKYTVRITASGFVTQTKTVTVQDGDQAIFNLDLAPK